MSFIERFLVEVSHLGSWIILSQFLHMWCLIWIKIHFYANRSIHYNFLKRLYFHFFCTFFWHQNLFIHIHIRIFQFSSIVQSCPTLRPHGLQHTRLLCPSLTPRACSNSCPSSQWWHKTIASSVVPFSFCLQSFLESVSFPMSQFFASDGQDIGVSASASVLPMNIQDTFPLGWTGLISLQSKGLSRVFSNISGCSILFHLSICFLDVNSMVFFD